MRGPARSIRVDLRLVGIERVAPDEHERVVLGNGESVRYDLLLLGSRIVPEATPGLTGEG